MKFLLFLLPFITKVYSINKNIIVLPNKIGVFAHIKTKDSFINYYCRKVDLLEFRNGWLYHLNYMFEGGKNLTNIDSYDNYNSLKKIDTKNNRFELDSPPFADESMNNTSNILYFLGYIDNNFYLKDKEKNYVYFGGIPRKIKENYNSFSLKGFKDINIIMKVKFDNDTIYETNIEKTKISFNPNYEYVICFTPTIFNLFFE